MRFPKDIDIHRVLLRKNFFFELPVDVVFIVIILVLIQEPPTSNFWLELRIKFLVQQ